MNFVEIAATAIEGDPTATDMELICRSAVAEKMRESRRLLTADEVEDLVKDEVVEETAVDPEEIVEEEGELALSDIEWDSIPEEDKVEVELGDEVIEGCVVAGKFHPAKIHPDSSVSRYARRITASMEEQAHIGSTLGITPKCLYNPVPDVTMPCPHCASRNVTPVWYDAGEVIALCNDCAEEFDASIEDVAKATLAERTVEDIDILPEHDVFGSVWYGEDGKFGYEVYASGDLVEDGAAETFEEIQERFDDIADAYEEIGEGTVIDLTSGDSEIIIDIDDDRIELESGKTASRARIARMVVDKRAFLDNSSRRRNVFVAGRMYAGKNGEQVLVTKAGGKLECEVWKPMMDGRVSMQLVTFTPKQLEAFLG